MAVCELCKRERDDLVAGVCATCRSPEVLLERISRLPEPMRGVFLRVGRDFGVVDGPGEDG